MTSPKNDVPQKADGLDMAGYGLATAGAVLFSSKGIFIKLAFAEGVSSEMLLALRMVVALPVYLVILVAILRREEKLRALLTPRRLALTMAIGILGYYISSYLDFLGLSLVTAQYERLVLFTYPFFVLIFGVWFFGDRMNWKLVPPMALSYSGLLVIFGWNMAMRPDGLIEGTLLVLGSAVTFAFYQHFARSQIVIIGAGLFTCIGMSTAALVAIGQNSVLNGLESFGQVTPIVWVYGLLLGIVGTVLPSFLMNAGISRIGARATSSTAALGPVATIILAVLILGEEFTLFHAVGTALVLVGALYFARTERRGLRPLD